MIAADLKHNPQDAWPEGHDFSRLPAATVADVPV